MKRSEILRGPCRIDFKGQSLFTTGDVKLDIDTPTQDIETSAQGKVGEIILDRMLKASFEPAGVWDTAKLAVTHPYFTTLPGREIFTLPNGNAGDSPLVIWSTDNKKFTAAAAAVTKMADINFAVDKNLFGSMEITGIGADEAAWSAADSLLKVETAAYVDSALGSILRQSYLGAFGGSAPWSSFTTKEGFTLSFDLKLSPLPIDRDGTVGMSFDTLSAMVRCIPVGVTEAQVLALGKFQGSGAARGVSIATANNFVVSGTGVTVTLNKAGIKQAGYQFGRTVLRVGELGFVASRDMASTALVTLA